MLVTNELPRCFNDCFLSFTNLTNNVIDNKYVHAFSVCFCVCFIVSFPYHLYCFYFFCQNKQNIQKTDKTTKANTHKFRQKNQPKKMARILKYAALSLHILLNTAGNPPPLLCIVCYVLCIVYCVLCCVYVSLFFFWQKKFYTQQTVTNFFLWKYVGFTCNSSTPFKYLGPHKQIWSFLTVIGKLQFCMYSIFFF